MRGVLGALAAVLAVSVSTTALGQDVKVFKAHETPSATDLADILFPPPAAEQKQMRFRGIEFDSPDPVPAPEAAEPGARTFAISIHFAYNSSEVPAEAVEALQHIGDMMKLERLHGARLIVEGHTDAAGSEEYNMGLSARRSGAVRDFLVTRCGISPDRLLTVAKGESELIDRQNPTAGVNRRVQFRPLQ